MVWWYPSVSPALRRLRRKDCSLKSAWENKTSSQKTQKKRKEKKKKEKRKGRGLPRGQQHFWLPWLETVYAPTIFICRKTMLWAMILDSLL